MEQEVMWLMMILLPIVGFMLGTLWNEAGHDLERSEDDD